MNYYDKEKECMPREQLEKLQLERLQDAVKRVYESVPYYREKMVKAGIRPEDIRSLDDLAILPFTTKQDFRNNYPFGVFAVPMSQVVRVHSSSGTTGKPTVSGHTRRDLETWAELGARALVAAGADADSKVQVSFGYGLFTGGLGMHYATEKLGATVIPTSSGNSARQIMIMQDFGVNILACTPSYALYLAETMQEMGIDPSDLQLKAGIFGAEPWSENMRTEIERKLNIKAFDIYGMSELMGPGVAVDCPCRVGMHIAEDHFIPEVINPETGERLKAGEAGELVITTITKEAVPLIRYRTRDLSRISLEPCACGRTHARMQKVVGRSDDMLIIRGVNVFPSAIETVLLQIPGVEPHYLLVVDRKDNLDLLEIQVEVSEQVFSDEVRKMESLGKRIKKEIENTLGISVKIRLVEPKTIERSEGKARRIIDNRSI